MVCLLQMIKKLPSLLISSMLTFKKVLKIQPRTFATKRPPSVDINNNSYKSRSVTSGCKFCRPLQDTPKFLEKSREVGWCENQKPAKLMVDGDRPWGRDVGWVGPWFCASLVRPWSLRGHGFECDSFCLRVTESL